MNATEIGILILGALVVLGVIVYNKWQERQYRQKVEAGFSRARKTGEDVLLARRDADFSISSDAPEDAAPSRDAEQTDVSITKTEITHEQGRADAMPMPESSPDSMVALPEEDLLSPMIDLIAELHGESPIDLAELRSKHAPMLVHFGRRLNWAGFDEAEGRWVFLPGDATAGGGRYRRLRVGLQLVDREGIVTPGTISAFLEYFPLLAEKSGLACQLPEGGLAEWQEQAGQLDAFCAGLDIVLCLSLVSESGRTFAGTQIRALAEAENMVLADGVYTLYDEHGIPLFRFWNTDEAHPFRAEDMKNLKSNDLTFQFDVPCVPRGQQVYLQMLAVIRRFAKVMNGTLIDDQGNPLADETLEQIRQDYVIRPQSHMMGEGLPAGSFLARRLFS